MYGQQPFCRARYRQTWTDETPADQPTSRMSLVLMHSLPLANVDEALGLRMLRFTA
ncbi:hypothetical protein BQ8794_180087 [Mesorhizobium prunaredense]|uniref:Uncharacterized protein n=3 Tax=Mesorhizobium TaxID=68287 RepID=A0A1R3V496_9HYPH|nr:conserved hypothetical protein [Mesorhizobium ventifaucium]SIT54743.1 hypothetical protein BQ8794_180087 [Mesorhizobium prunaredense]SJM31911.1 hypothetical protein BQ8482_220082 [Mesorhizobium delmotii]